MKILIVVPDTGVGGITTAAVNLSNERASRGHTVCFLDMSAGYLCAEVLDEKVKLLSLKGKSKFWNIGNESVRRAGGVKKLGILTLGAMKKLTIRSGLWYKLIFSKFNEYGEFDVAIAFRQCAPCYSLVLNKVNAKKKIGFVHGELTYMGDISSWQKYMTSFDKIAYVSGAVREQFVAKYPELEKNACTVYNTFDIEQIKMLAEEKCDIEFDKNKVNIVTVSRIDNAFKQIQWIVYVCEKIKREKSLQFHWYVVGDGPNFDETVALSRERGTDDVLTFVGNRKNPYPFVKQSDFTVLTSKSEAYPMVVIESFVLGKPIVVARFGSINEMMEDGKHGYIAEQSVESVANLVLGMIRNDDGMYSRCTEFFKDYKYTNDVAYNQILDAIGDIK